MSRKISISSTTQEELDKISQEVQVSQEASKYAYNAAPRIIYMYEQRGDELIIPFAYNTLYPRPVRNCKTTFAFQGELREMQIVVKDEAISHLNQYGSTIISAYTGFGKSALSLYIAAKIALKTIIVCHRVVLINQWKESINRFCPKARVQIITTSSTKEDSDFYIINAMNIPKHPESFYSDIQMVIVDEAHIIMAEKMSIGMKYLFPRYCMGLSATPYRTDGLDGLLDLYFGKRKIVRKLSRKHTVYRVETEFKPEVKVNRMGKVDWGSVIESQCTNEERNKLIVSIILHFSDRVFLVMCKRVEQARWIRDELKRLGEDVTSLFGTQQTFIQSSRILVGTSSKTGVGFDHPRLDTLLLASDVEQYFVQYLGRVFRREDVEPIIFDLVDSYPLLEKHYKTRKAIYVEHGGTVKKFDRTILDR